MYDLGDASDSDVDPLGGVHRGAGHGQGHGVQRHPATPDIFIILTIACVRFYTSGCAVSVYLPLDVLYSRPDEGPAPGYEEGLAVAAAWNITVIHP